MADEQPTVDTDTSHAVKAAVLTRAIEEGKGSVPAEPAPLVCKPRQLESWRIFKIMSEFVDGFELIRKYGLAGLIAAGSGAAIPGMGER